MPPMINNPLAFAEAYDKSDANNNSVISEPVQNEVKSIKVSLMFLLAIMILKYVLNFSRKSLKILWITRIKLK